MSASASPLRIGIYGIEKEVGQTSRGCALWPPGYAAAVTAAGGTPVLLTAPRPGSSWDQALENIDGVVFLGYENRNARQAAEEERFCLWCREHRLPILAIDEGLLALNLAFNGTIHQDLPRELPQALQHRHPPEPGLRHAIMVDPGTRLCELYGEGEIVVNSEHRRAINRLARGFRVSARALDGVIEAIEAEADGWFALGVQWQPASASASGLDIQLFRGLTDVCRPSEAAGPKLAASAA